MALKALHSRSFPVRLGEAKRVRGIFGRQAGRLSCPRQDFWLYRAHTKGLYLYYTAALAW